MIELMITLVKCGTSVLLMYLVYSMLTEGVHINIHTHRAGTSVKVEELTQASEDNNADKTVLGNMDAVVQTLNEIMGVDYEGGIVNDR